jgi:transposase
MYVGLDISKNYTVGVWKDERGNKIAGYTFPTDKSGLKKLAEKLKDCEIAVEASTSGVFVYDYLVAQGLSVKVANPNAIKLISHSDKKTDKSDAEKLADLLRTNMLPICYVPGKRTRDIRDLIRHRRALVNTKTALKNKIRAILTRAGLKLPYRDVLGKRSLQWLYKAEVDQVQKDAINKFLSLALMIDEDVHDYNRKLQSECQQNGGAQLLETIPGIGYYSAMHIMSAIGDISRFPSDEELASYAGLVPRIYQSGDTQYTRGLKQGEKSLKWILIEASHTAVKISKRFRKYYRKKLRKKNHQKAIVAVARKMVEIIYCMLTRGEEYHE